MDQEYGLLPSDAQQQSNGILVKLANNFTRHHLIIHTNNQNNNFARASRFFVHFVAVNARL